MLFRRRIETTINQEGFVGGVEQDFPFVLYVRTAKRELFKENIP